VPTASAAFSLILIALVGTSTFAQMGPTTARDSERGTSSRSPEVEPYDFESYVNGLPPQRAHYPVGVFLGAGTTPEKLAALDRALQSPELRGRASHGDPSDPTDDRFEGDYAYNGLAGRGFEDYELVGFGSPNPLVEIPRLVLDHVGVHALSTRAPASPYDDIEGHYYDFLFCHSNGCTLAFDLQRSGMIHAKVIVALGTDRLSEPLSDMKGARVYFFRRPWDPVPWIGGSKLGAAGSAPVLQEELPFENPASLIRDLAEGVTSRFTLGRASTDPYPAFVLDPVPGKGGGPSLARPFGAHALLGYFEALAATPWEDLPEDLRKASIASFGAPEPDRHLHPRARLRARPVLGDDDGAHDPNDEGDDRLEADGSRSGGAFGGPPRCPPTCGDGGGPAPPPGPQEPSDPSSSPARRLGPPVGGIDGGVEVGLEDFETR
jgi:hypothetical protein